MRGILRPCRNRLGPELHARWLGHLCGLCLSLRDTAGQSARVLTGYDILLVSVLTEAQTGRLPTTTAGPCALRGFRTAEVVEREAMAPTTAVALLAGSASLDDKIDDGDVPAWSTVALRKASDRFGSAGRAAACVAGLDGTTITAASGAAHAAERRIDASLDELLAPAARVVADLFSQSATAAGVSANIPALTRAGDAFGRIVHLVDAVEDRDADRRHGRFNPLDATATSDADAGRVARTLHAQLLAALGDAHLVDGDLAEALLGDTLAAAITRVWGPATPSVAPRPAPRRSVALGIAAMLSAQLAMWGGRPRGRRWSNGPYGPPPYDPYYGGRGYRRRGCGGLSCGELLACDCCANCLCNDCCGGDVCCCAA